MNDFDERMRKHVRPLKAISRWLPADLLRVAVPMCICATVVSAPIHCEGRSDERLPDGRPMQCEGTSVEIAPERRAAIRAAEDAYLRRQLYDPVAAALKAESPETQEKWQGILSTAEVLLGLFTCGAFPVHREFAGSGAVCAYTNGCRYPVPVGFAYASKYKRADAIQSAFSNLYVNIGHDARWNSASRMTFYGFMSIVDEIAGKKIPNAPPSLTNACNRALADATYGFLKECDYGRDEVGIVYRMLGQCVQHEAIAEACARLKAEGVALDPWLDLMLQARVAYCRAWDARGKGFADTVTEEGWRIYGKETRKALALLEKAYGLRPELCWSCSLALSASLGNDVARELWLGRLLACRPDETLGLSAYLFGLRPRWCGSNRLMADFLLSLVRKRQFDTMVPVFAYERIVKDVFASEGGVALTEGAFPNVDKFVRSCRKDFEPYFAAYRGNGIEKRLPFAGRVHLYMALADLAWRLEDEDELLHWAGKFEALKMPARETQFDGGYRQYGPHLSALRRLDGARRHDFLAGLHALYMDGDPAVIDRMREIADGIGESRLAFECALVRKGKVNLIPFMKESGGAAAHPAKALDLNFRGRQRDHMVFRVRLRSGENLARSRFSLKVVHCVKAKWRPQFGNAVGVAGGRGEVPQNQDATCGVVEWPRDRETCAFEFEIVGNRTRLTQDGVCLAERPLSAIPSLCDIFSISGFFGSEVTVQKFEMEILDSADFVLPSVPRRAKSVPPAAKPAPQPAVRLGPALGGVCPKAGCCGDRLKPANLLLGTGYLIRDGMVELTGEGTFDKLGLELQGFGDCATVVVDCGSPKGGAMGAEVVLASFTLDRIPNRVMVVADTKSGDVYAVAQVSEQNIAPVIWYNFEGDRYVGLI